MKKKRLPSRRRRALHWMAALGLLLAGNCLLGLYCITPQQALRQTERRYGVVPAELLKTMETPLAEDPGLRRWQLSANDGELLLSSCRFEPLRGWTCQIETLLRDADTPLSAGIGSYCNETGHGYETGYVFFGVVRDPEIAAVEVSASHSSLGEVDGQYQLSPDPEERAEVSAFITMGDHRVFMTELPLVYDPGGSTYPNWEVRGLFADGTSVSVETVFHGIRR